MTFISSMRQDALSIYSEKKKNTQHGFFPDGENFPVDPKCSDGTC